jgi:hypothetical protein
VVLRATASVGISNAEVCALARNRTAGVQATASYSAQNVEMSAGRLQDLELTVNRHPWLTDSFSVLQCVVLCGQFAAPR